LHSIIGTLDFTSFLDKALEDRIPLGAALSILKDQGIYEGNVFLEWMRARLAEKGKTQFGDLVIPEFADDPRYRYRLQVIASDVTGRRMLVLPRDAGLLDIPPDDMEIAMAVRMSSSIPIFYEPVRIVTDGEERLIVDGGMLSNFPVWLFDSKGPPDWPTFGLKLVDPKPREPAAGTEPPPPVKGFLQETLGFITGLISTMTDAHDKLYLEQSDFVRTITISNLGVKTTEFTLSPQRAEELFGEGRSAAESFLDTWDFEAYRQAFRVGRGPTRREQVAAQLEAVGPAGSGTD
jgi:NTE family protein